MKQSPKDFAVPRPRLALRVGFTGHLPGPRLGPHTEGLRRAIAAVLASIRDALPELQTFDDHSYDRDQAADLRFVSALARGADTLGAEAALDQGFALEHVLPFSPDAYAADFEAPADLAAFRGFLTHDQATGVFSLDMPRGPAIDWRAYRAAGEMIADNCDILLAVWDSMDHGKLGGTEDVIRLALDRSVPVLAIGTSPPHNLRLIEWGGASQSLPQAGLKSLVRSLVMPPDHAQRGRRMTEGEARRRFMGEDGPGGAGRLGRFIPWPWIGARLAIIARAFAHHTHDLSPPRQFPVEGELAPPPGGAGIGTHFAAVDAISTRLGFVYRTSFTLIYLISALAVLTGLASVFWIEDMHVKAWLVTAEIAMIGLVIGLFVLGRRASWHWRWLDTRRVSEVLRVAQSLAPLGGMPQRAQGGTEPDDWTSWYCRAVLRAERLPCRASATPDYLHREIRRFLSGTLQEQINYHDRAARMLRQMHHGLDRMGLILLNLSLLSGAVFVVAVLGGVFGAHPHGDGFAKTFKSYVTLASAGFPALGAALYGIRAQGDYEASAERSRGTLLELEQCGRELETLLANPHPGFTEVRATFAWAAEVMQTDLTLWRSLYRNRPLAMLA